MIACRGRGLGDRLRRIQELIRGAIMLGHCLTRLADGRELLRLLVPGSRARRYRLRTYGEKADTVEATAGASLRRNELICIAGALQP